MAKRLSIVAAWPAAANGASRAPVSVVALGQRPSPRYRCCDSCTFSCCRSERGMEAAGRTDTFLRLGAVQGPAPARLSYRAHQRSRWVWTPPGLHDAAGAALGCGRPAATAPETPGEAMGSERDVDVGQGRRIW